MGGASLAHSAASVVGALPGMSYIGLLAKRVPLMGMHPTWPCAVLANACPQRCRGREWRSR